MSAKNALDHIRAHHAGLEKVSVSCEIIPFQMFSDPMTTEDYFDIAAAEESKNPALKAKRFAGFLVRKLKLEDGTPAFRSPKGDAADVLAREIPPTALFDLVGQIASAKVGDEVKEVEKKPEPQAEA